ncbi:glycosyltransferase [Roseateles chitinivorans]|uniref:glycosyltransferase n=1 Tax=Roseateles chitinivorans TaxID=2917965 RepID=UPI00117F48AC|nr:glycosyltransferase [Roseateles chitinivorans]
MNRPAARRPGTIAPLPAAPLAAPAGVASASPTVHVVEVVGAVPPDETTDELSSGLAAAADRLGATELVERLLERLGPEDGLRFTVVCPADGAFAERMRARGAEVVIVAMPDDPPWHAIQVLVGLIRNRQADVLHAHLPNAHRLAGLAGGITRTPVLSSVQGAQLDMPDLEVHRLIASQLSVVSEASYFHALGLGIAQERISLDPFDAEADGDAMAASLDALGERLRGVATQTAVAGSRGAAQARALTQPLTAEPVPAVPAGAPAVRAVLDELVPGRTRTVARDR